VAIKELRRFRKGLEACQELPVVSAETTPPAAPTGLVHSPPPREQSRHPD
jgi:hypothetical protein